MHYFPHSVEKTELFNPIKDEKGMMISSFPSLSKVTWGGNGPK